MNEEENKNSWYVVYREDIGYWAASSLESLPKLSIIIRGRLGENSARRMAERFNQMRQSYIDWQES